MAPGVSTAPYGSGYVPMKQNVYNLSLSLSNFMREYM